MTRIETRHARTGIIGGSGLYALEGMEVLDRLEIDTPFGAPSAPLTLARIGGQEVVFLPRHGEGHTIPPHRINYPANLCALKLAGCVRIVSISAVGSLRESIQPGDFVLVDQFVDRTSGRPATFFDGPAVAHVSLADPVCAALRGQLLDACRAEGIRTHDGGCYLAMQGPQFSTRAESALYRSWGMDVIGMTNMPEAKLAREAEMCYATVAMCTDYDCWHESEEDVTVESVIEVMHRNVAAARAMLARFLREPIAECVSGCRHALDAGLFADLKSLDDAALRKIHPLVERLL
ncbi:MAG: S-methyl-5'-thioadenosine phosphorylase [Mariprofundaceae bacterium]